MCYIHVASAHEFHKIAATNYIKHAFTTKMSRLTAVVCLRFYDPLKILSSTSAQVLRSGETYLITTNVYSILEHMKGRSV